MLHAAVVVLLKAPLLVHHVAVLVEAGGLPGCQAGQLPHCQAVPVEAGGLPGCWAGQVEAGQLPR